MKIAEANVAMTASRSYSESYEQRESLQVKVQPPSAGQLELSDQVTTSAAGFGDVFDDETRSALMQTLKALLVEILSGHKLKVIDPDDLNSDETNGVSAETDSAGADSQSQRVGWGVSYDYSATYTESESLEVGASGTVRTSAGQEFAFELKLSMSRSFVEQNNVRLRLGDAALSDPLVVNYGAPAARLGGFSFVFDFEGDGGRDSLPGLAAGSAYLALDRDGDGQISNGRELFGPASGDGWSELGGYDQDANGWIDENDAIFTKLRLWQPQADGSESLCSLKECGIGAIMLSGVELPFDLKNSANETEGRVLSTGLFLSENGQSGSVQQLDLLV